MSGIVCAIRAGPGSRPTIDKAIQLAGETGLTLYFLYVVNLDFMAHTTSSRTQTIYKELDQMGEFILLNAQSTAETQGVTAEGVVRHGQVGEEIIGLSQEMDADYVILGQPQDQPEENVFADDQFQQFIQRIEEEGGVEVVLVEGEGA